MGCEKKERVKGNSSFLFFFFYLNNGLFSAKMRKATAVTGSEKLRGTGTRFWIDSVYDVT